MCGAPVMIITFFLWKEKLSGALVNVNAFLAGYMNQNPISDVVNPIYQHPGPPRTLLPTISSDHTETEYLNYFKNGAAGPEYLNEILSPAVLPLTSNGTVHSIEKYLPQQSIDNPDYQQDFTPTFKTHTNGHIPAAENAEYLGPDWLSGMWQEIRDYLWKALSSVSWLDCWVVPPYSVLSYEVSWQFEQHCWHSFKLNQSHSKDFFFSHHLQTTNENDKSCFACLSWP